MTPMGGSLSTSLDRHNSLVLGIDTGGTYTDGVLLDYGTREVLATTKTLTTRHDLTQCVGTVLEQLSIQDPSQVKSVSISTTLATNAIAEGHGRRVALALVGYDPELVEAYNLAERLGTKRFRYFRGGYDLQGAEQAPLEEEAIVDWIVDLVQRGEIDAVAVSAYFSPLNNEHESRIYRTLIEASDLPVVLGHELSMDLDSIQRATTATLNASLLAILRDFITAVAGAMGRRGIDAPLMVVKGDGTLVSAEAVARRPVETVHSGPAASAVGARFLSGLDRALVVDIGGTTTDLAVVDEGQVNLSDTGAMVGGYRTAVKGVDLHSIGLGGDSHIRFATDDTPIIGPQRVVPLAYLAYSHDQVHRQLLSLPHRSLKELSLNHLVYWYLVSEPTETLRRRHGMVAAVIDLLAEGPRSLHDILQQLGLFHPLQFSPAVRDLVREEIVGLSGLTPTDLLHYSGSYTAWDEEAAQAAVVTVCHLTSGRPDDLVEMVMTSMTETIVRAILSFLTARELPPRRRFEDRDFGWWLFENSLYPSHAYLNTQIALDMPVVGIGAPAHIFLNRVTRALHTELVLPPHFSVANAVGAVAGSVVVAREAVIFPHLVDYAVVGYYVQAGDGRQRFGELDPALEYARRMTEKSALEEAIAAGAGRALLDNMSVEGIREAVRAGKGRIVLEASGGLRPGGLRGVAETGVDFLSVGWLTHSVTAADVAMETEEAP
jgi:N-methylhydantoinase A/oxoprolinase/acetone carboxylase beta subunit